PDATEREPYSPTRFGCNSNRGTGRHLFERRPEPPSSDSTIVSCAPFDKEEEHMGALPDAIEELLESALVGELTVIDDRGRPVTHPLIPLYDGERIYMTSSVLFSRKLEHIKANPKVSFSITDHVGCPGLEHFHRVTIQGDATVDDSDLHSGWE